MPRFLQTGQVDGGWETFKDDSKAFLRPMDIAPYLSASIPKLKGRIGRAFVWWRDDYDFGDCELEDTLVLVNEWVEGGWVHLVDALVVEVNDGDIEMGERY